MVIFSIIFSHILIFFYLFTIKFTTLNEKLGIISEKKNDNGIPFFMAKICAIIFTNLGIRSSKSSNKKFRDYGTSKPKKKSDYGYRNSCCPYRKNLGYRNRNSGSCNQKSSSLVTKIPVMGSKRKE